MHRNEIKKNTNTYNKEDLVNPIIYIKQKHTEKDLDEIYSRNKGLEAQVLRLEAKLKDFDTRIQQMDDKSRAQLNWWLSPK